MTAPITVRDFCDQHRACDQGREWALAQPVATMRDLWRMDILPQRRVWIATRQGVMPDRDLRLFTIWCARRALALVADPSPSAIAALDIAERYAHGQATKDEMRTPYAAAARTAAAAYAAADAPYAAADAYAAYVAAYAAAAAAAADAAADAAYAAAAAAAADAAADAAYAAATAAAYAAETTASAAARKAQADHLITLLPEFPL